jgi:ubiquinone/menaquinone biosynthesis C-methylase UbiE
MKSKDYFDGISNEWDEIRQSFFSDSIREKMCETAQVKEGLTAADVGAGTGFVTEELLNRKLRVITIDQSQEMLDVLCRKFSSIGEISCVQADAYSIPLKNDSVDVMSLK